MALVKVKSTGAIVKFNDKHAETICAQYPNEWELVMPAKISLQDLQPKVEKKNPVVIAEDEVKKPEIIEPRKLGRPSKK